MKKIILISILTLLLTSCGTLNTNNETTVTPWDTSITVNEDTSAVVTDNDAELDEESDVEIELEAAPEPVKTEKELEEERLAEEARMEEERKNILGSVTIDPTITEDVEKNVSDISGFGEKIKEYITQNTTNLLDVVLLGSIILEVSDIMADLWMAFS